MVRYVFDHLAFVNCYPGYFWISRKEGKMSFNVYFLPGALFMLSNLFLAASWEGAGLAVWGMS